MKITYNTKKLKRFVYKQMLNINDLAVTDFHLIDFPPDLIALFHWKKFSLLIVFYVFLVSTMSTLKVGVTEKKGACMRLREQLEALEKETAAKLAEMDQYNKDMQVRTEYK